MSTQDNFAATWAAIKDNESAIEYLFNSTNLPHPSVTPLESSVLVTVGDVDDLDVWHAELGGAVVRGPELCGFQLWVLQTSMEWLAGRRVSVFVSCSVPMDAAVMPELRAAVAA